MKVLETSFLVDYLDKEPYTLEFLEGHFEADYVITTITLYELYAGAIRTESPDETITTVADALEWADPIVFDETAAREAADIRATLLDRGEPIPAPDTLNAGIARALGSELVATDAHFSAIPRLGFVNPREN